MTIHTPAGTFEAEVHSDQIEATSWWRPDPSWVFIDAAGHEHVWFSKGERATSYRPDAAYVVPSVEKVVDVEESEDYPAVTHLECRVCRAVVKPGYCPDDHRQFVAGIRSEVYRIDGQRVAKDEFYARAKAAGLIVD